ncbi:phosphoribosyl-ATP pyrophosphatase [Candidatus Carsonella ruddii]|uniref:Phosphoribosyl-ATP pyrophosphatase n=1 Tax=Carsonella ruddii TaxID=114186 RepID=A0A2K8K5W4_CARRU|nr:phosphoribosyl-ATP pyrophosphatase [Candidatus Carsonella ruddii]ATX33454.1 phosphoribosyl-ATP pyrophosphatase [Candidatus Carsonella ruddii]
MIKKIIKIIKNKFIVSKSYSKYILLNNFEFLFKKIFEEIFEIYISFNKYYLLKNCYNRYFLIKEICDLLYHIIIFIIFNNISYFEIEKEFIRREKISGFKEKQFR